MLNAFDGARNLIVLASELPDASSTSVVTAIEVHTRADRRALLGKTWKLFAWQEEGMRPRLAPTENRSQEAKCRECDDGRCHEDVAFGTTSSPATGSMEGAIDVPQKIKNCPV